MRTKDLVGLTPRQRERVARKMSAEDRADLEQPYDGRTGKKNRKFDRLYGKQARKDLRGVKAGEAQDHYFEEMKQRIKWEADSLQKKLTKKYV